MKGIKILGIPFKAGQPHAGVAEAPEALRAKSLIPLLRQLSPGVEDLGDLDFSLCGEHEEGQIKNERASALGNALISESIQSENLGQSFLLNIGGDHGMALGTIHGLLHHHPDLIVVWADAHGDINTPGSSQSGNFHGMPLSFLLKGNQGREEFSWLRKQLRPERLIFMGPRDLDPAEKEIIRELGIQWYSSDDINSFGTEALLSRALKIADPDGTAPIHLSFDIDVFDPQDVIATGTRVPQGPEKNEMMKLGRLLGETGRLRSMDLVEVNPDFSHETNACETIDLAMQFTLSVTASVFAHHPAPLIFPRESHPQNKAGTEAPVLINYYS